MILSNGSFRGFGCTTTLFFFELYRINVPFFVTNILSFSFLPLYHNNLSVACASVGVAIGDFSGMGIMGDANFGTGCSFTGAAGFDFCCICSSSCFANFADSGSSVSRASISFMASFICFCTSEAWCCFILLS